MFESLSAIQKEIVFNKSGKFVVRACPGSGKTYCVGARLARLSQNWEKKYQGIAVISFTNVAWKEIDKKFSEEFVVGKSITFPHFIGTIDSFINRYIFLPHGHLVLKCNCRPILVGEPHGIWTGKYFSDSLFDNISYDINGDFYAINARRMRGDWMNNTKLLRTKKNINKGGYATQADANYFAMKLLEKHPSIAKSIAKRFPFLIVDEAQDTSEIQMKIIDLLIENGLNEVMLVGDPDQAIFEWNDARPDLLNQKFEHWPESIVLNENRRSSQNICNATFNISSLTSTSSSICEEVKDCDKKPKVIVYNNNLSQIIDDFIVECEQNEITISEDNVSVIFRSKTTFNEITGIEGVRSSPWNDKNSYTKDFAKGKYLYDNGDYKKGFKIIEKALIKQLRELSYCSEEDLEEEIQDFGFTQLRTEIFHFIKILPNTSITLGEWISTSNRILKKEEYDFEFSAVRTAMSYSFPQIFAQDSQINNEINYRLDTVHGVKGETFQATLLILKTRGMGKTYKTLLNQNVPISESEELRITYVGMTRPKKILVIAVPNDDNKDAWERKLNLNT